MSFWYRISQPKLKWQTLTRQFQRCYLQITHAHSVNNTPHKIIRGFENSYWVNGGKPSDFCYDIRFFATRTKRKFPMKSRLKPEEKKEPSGPRLNDQINAKFVRLVTDDGHEIVSRMVALERARKLQLDLVEVQQNADPPVCKIMDFHKEKYKKQMMQKERVKSKPEDALRKGEKEVRFKGKTDAKDLKMKADLVRKMVDDGYRVKCVAMDATKDQDLGELLSRLCSLIEDVAVVESEPQVDKRQAFVTVRHIRFGASKKGSGKKAASEVAGFTSSEDASDHVERPLELEEESDPAETDVDREDDEVLSDENKGTWSVFDENDEFDKVFDFSDGTNSTGKQTNAKLETATSLENTNIFNFPRPILDSTRKNSVPSAPVEQPPPETQNRYKKSEPRNRSIPTTPMDDRGRGATNPLRSAAPQFLNQGKQTPSHMDSSPSTRGARQDRTDASPFRNSKLPLDEFWIPKHEESRPGPPPSSQQHSYGAFTAPKAAAPGKLDPSPNTARPEPRLPNQGKPSLSDFPSRGIGQLLTDASVPRNSRTTPMDDCPKPEQSRPRVPHVPPSRPPTSSFGIFSASTATAPGKQATVSEPARNPTAGGVSNMNIPSKSDGIQREGADQGGQGRWGMFSTGSDSEAKAQR